MANEEHLAILKRGVGAWNDWRTLNPELKPDLSGADLGYAKLRGVNLKEANLRRVNLNTANLRESNLSGADLGSANLYKADLKDASLYCAYLYRAYLFRADLSGANLQQANLKRSQVVGTNFEYAILTGSCIAEWNINADTNFDNVVCDYVYLEGKLDRSNWSKRSPSNPTRNFAPGEFKALFQKALETIDLFFADGIDWKAFFQSFQELQTQYADQELSIQAIEKKPSGAFVIRLETPAVDVDKAAIESAAMEKYQAQLHLLESRYEERLQLQGEQLAFYRQQTEIERNRNTKLDRIIEVMAEKAGNTNYYGTIKATNFAPHGTAIGGTFNDYSQTITNNLDEIGQLITTLRSQAEQFPPNARDDVLEHLNDLQEDLQHPDQGKPSRLKASLSTIFAISVGLGGAIATATDFSNNVLELGKKFGVELVHPQGTQSPHSQSTQTVDLKRLEGGH